MWMGGATCRTTLTPARVLQRVAARAAATRSEGCLQDVTWRSAGTPVTDAQPQPDPPGVELLVHGKVQQAGGQTQLVRVRP